LYFIDHDDTIYHYKQIYHTKRTVEDHCKGIKKMVAGLQIEAWVTDHDAEDRATLEKHLGVRTIAAYKSVLPGIEAVKIRLRDKRIKYNRGALQELDLELEKIKQPTCTIDELPGYRWSDKKQDTPVKEKDHALDELRYLVAYVDKVGQKVKQKARSFSG
jgi:phage terminase large subunit